MNDLLIDNDLKNISNYIQSDFFRSKRILVTGGAGFLGSWLCDVLLELGSIVTCLDDFSTGLSANVKHLTNNKNFTFLKSRVEENFDIASGCDVIIHMASRPSPDDYIRFPVETLDANSKGTSNVLNLARKYDSLVLFASTSEVYGDPTIIPTPESYWGNVNPTGIRSCYDEGKRFSEALLMAHNREFGMDVRIVRIFNTYGPRIRADGAYGRALPRFILQSLKNQNITIHGDGLQTRSFCYVTDTIRGILKCLLVKDVKAKPVNIGNQNEITILELARKIKNITGSILPVQFVERPKDDPQRRCPDLSFAKKVLSWEPTVNLEQGLEKTITWLKNVV